MDSDEIKLLLVKYITKQASETEIKEVKQWIKLHPENELYFIELYEAWQNLLYINPHVIDEDKAYRTFLNKLPVPESEAAPHKKLIKYAAVCVLLLVPAILIMLFYPVKTVTGNKLVAERGAIKKITLSDGTIVWLNAGSTIKYDAEFGKTNRSVYLEGEAFFEIAHGKNAAPFTVGTKNYIVRDIGTKFNLKAYPADPFFETTVVNGEVSVQSISSGNLSDDSRIYVKPHQVLKIYYGIQKENLNAKQVVAGSGIFNEVHVSQVDSAKMKVYDGWKEDLLLFDSSTLGEISKVLERRYNVKIFLNDDELAQIKYSGSFKNVPTIEKVLQIIKQNTPINYAINGQNITINKTNNYFKTK